MKCSEFRAELARWMDASWEHSEPELPSAMVDHAQTCPNCASRSLAAVALVRPAPLQHRAPESLRSRIMDRVLADAARSEANVRPFTPTRASRGRVRRVAWLSAAAAVLVLATSLTTVAVMRPGVTNQVEVHLVLEAPTARSVSVVGDWNAWEPDVQRLMDPDRDGKWEITIKVERDGEYRYQFIVDGETWVSDPAAPLQVQDGFGGTNSVLNI